MPNSDGSVKSGVSITATARLHMGFFDLNGGLGRRFGSIGVSLDQPSTELCAWPTQGFTADGIGAERAIKTAEKLAEALRLQGLNLPGGLHMRLKQSIPEHAGLGSGTQMALAVGLAMNRLYDLQLSLNDVAKFTSRGARSGIGLGTFSGGGVIVDGGRGANTLVPPVIARADFPEDWRVVLIFDKTDAGIHGQQEIEAFRNLPEFSAEASAILCRHVLMQALPALAEQDLITFGAAICELQERTGDHFAPAQGGRYASPQVAEVLLWLKNQGAACFGQSSWGPTGFAIFANQQEAETFLQALQIQFEQQTALKFWLCRGRNEGGVVRDIEAFA
ncbi:MAG: beta-ribofuranosylaminobenzene 5'-phosphate synthase family protein [Methylophilaceae bacterium]